MNSEHFKGKSPFFKLESFYYFLGLTLRKSYQTLLYRASSLLVLQSPLWVGMVAYSSVWDDWAWSGLWK